jgi:hypothetical protein
VTSEDTKVRVYALAHPGALYDERSEIAKAVLGALKLAPSTANQVTLAEASGWLDFRVLGELWERKTAPALLDAATAAKTAEQALVALERACSSANKAWPAAIKTIALFPPMANLRRAQVSLVARPTDARPDHWLYRGEPRLVADGGSTKLRVLGTQLEVRIGHEGRVIGVRSRWRPITGEHWTAEPHPFVPREAEGSKQSEEPSEPIQGYLLDGDGIPQHYLAPYWFQSEGPDFITASASAWSLTVDVGRVSQGQTGMGLLALAQGGSGDYQYNWAMYSLRSFEHGFQVLGPGRTARIDTRDGKASASSISLDNGEYVVLLNVRDRATGAFKHHQQQVFSAPFPGPDSSFIA